MFVPDNIRDPYFVFNGMDSRKMDIVSCSIKKRTRAKKRVKKIEVPGRDGALYETDGSRENFEIEIECIVKNDSKKIDSLCSWLDGSGELILSTDLEKRYKVRIDNKIDIEEIMHYFNKFILIFDAYPYAYSVNEYDDLLELEKPAAILNKGTAEAEPTITIYGAGEVSLSINNIVYKLKSVSGYVTINSEIMEVYKGDDNESEIYTIPENTENIFPILKKGENNISWIGNVQKVVIEPNWRWL